MLINDRQIIIFIINNYNNYIILYYNYNIIYL